jgi:DNA polymerase/3'-5' exonuclease PolX
MNKKEIILYNLNELKKIYMNNEDKKWNLRAVSVAITSISKYNNEIISGNQLKEKIKGIGEKIAKRIDEILLTGTLKELDNNSGKNNDQNNDQSNDQNKILDELLLVTGIGIVRAKKLISSGIKDIESLKEGINNKIIKSTHHIDIGIKYYNDLKIKIPRDEIDKIKIIINNVIKKIDKDLLFEICGSYRRGLSESGDIDILISNPNYLEDIYDQQFLNKIVKELEKINFIIDHLTSKGNTKFMGICRINKTARRIDIRIVNYQSYYTSIIYFTGSKEFNIYLRKEALSKNYTLNEYFLTNIHTGEHISIHSEKEIFEILKIPYLEPKERIHF